MRRPGQPKTHDGPVEALRLLKMVQRSAHKSRTQAVNQLRDLVATAPDELRDRAARPAPPRAGRDLRRVPTRPSDDDLASITRLALRELAQRIAELDDETRIELDSRRHRITTTIAPALCAAHGIGPGHRQRAAARRRGQP